MTVVTAVTALSCLVCLASGRGLILEVLSLCPIHDGSE